MYKYLSLVSLSTLTLLADDYGSRIQKLETQVSEIREENLSGSAGGKNPSARGCPANDNNLFVTGDFLYWRASISVIPYAYEIVKADFPTASIKGNWIRIDYDWEPGFRAGIGWNTPYDGWDVYLNWTHIHNRSHDHIDGKFTDGGFGVASGYNVIGGGTVLGLPSAKATWKFRYNTLDLDLGSAFYLKRTFSIHPHIGVRAGWLDQDLDARYEGGHASPFPGPQFQGPLTFNGDTDFWGIGPRIGLDTNWRFGHGFSLYGNVATALLYGKVTSRSLQKATLVATGELLVTEDNRDSFKDLKPTLQLAMGAAWGTCFYHDKMFFGLSLGWETNYWWDQNDINGTHDLFYNGAITLEGLTLSAKLDF